MDSSSLSTKSFSDSSVELQKKHNSKLSAKVTTCCDGMNFNHTLSPVSGCRDAAPSPYTTLPTDAGTALTNGLLTVHTAVTSSFGLMKVKHLPAQWLDIIEDIMHHVQQDRSAITIDLAHRLEKDHPEFHCTDMSPGRAFPYYWSLGVLLDGYLSLALGELPPRYHLHMDDLKLQDVREPLVDVVTRHFPELMDKNKRCIFKRFLKIANEVLTTILIGEEVGKDNVEVQVTENDPEFPSEDPKMIWFPPIGQRCGQGVVGQCPHAFCEYHAHRSQHDL